MGLLLIGVVAGVLLGFGLYAPSQGYFQQCASPGCFDRNAAIPPVEAKPAAFRPDRAIAKANSATAIKSSKRSSAKKRKASALAKASRPPTRISIAASDRPAEAPDTVLSKAKASIAAKMEDPASVEFGDMNRAMRKNTFGRPMDTICGHVRGKNGARGDTVVRPFLYLVKEDDAYVVDGKPGSAASTAYRNICN